MLAILASIQGSSAIKRAFKELEPKLARRVIRQAERKALKVIQSAARSNAPVRTGAGRRKIRVRTSKGPRGSKRGVIAMAVLVGEAKGPTWYMWLQEHGYTIGKRIRSGGKTTGYTPTRGQVKKIRGLHFVRRAMRSHEGEVKQIMASEILAGIEREAKV